MHVNPYFCQHSQKIQPVPKGKIYINPNFVKSNGITNQVPFMAHHTYGKPISLIHSSNNVSPPLIKTNDSSITVSIKTPSSEPFHSTSRYSLLRPKGTELPKAVPTNIQTQTVKISKYKSIKITEMRKTLDTIKPLNAGKSTTLKVTTKHNSIVSNLATNNVDTKSPNAQVNRYRIVRPSVNVVSKAQFKRQLSNNSRKVVCSRTRIKTFGVYKKNNIPCPQYRKYGKCLRKLHGKCDFLHDKKHVSICRKFLNGVCHDSLCLLSHELSDTKLPTCYFYLRGMCTKDGCPYLHVKLNEKAKVCSEFTRGYCEKGDKCLHRHITKNTNSNRKRRHSIRKQSPQKSMKYKVEKNRTKYNKNNAQSRNSATELHLQFSREKTETGSRYYRDSVEETTNNESLEVIKPSRCKLGTLPSFIQL
ncbi:zinc finger CCCH domain-containing protein 3 [Choristoneura fumiferana]|uniref:zinc finger CCCH domain-containing protein 3 n=1 Tax=Choristoneura fumiferana TaxID=7141 RepID=UPI003D15655A